MGGRRRGRGGGRGDLVLVGWTRRAWAARGVDRGSVSDEHSGRGFSV